MSLLQATTPMTALWIRRGAPLCTRYGRVDRETLYSFARARTLIMKSGFGTNTAGAAARDSRKRSLLIPGKIRLSGAARAFRFTGLGYEFGDSGFMTPVLLRASTMATASRT